MAKELVQPSFRELGYAAIRPWAGEGAYCIAHGKTRGAVLPHTPVTPLRMLQTFAPLDEPEPAAVAHAARVAGYDPTTVRLVVVRRSLDARKGHPIGFHLEIAVWPPDGAATDADEGLPA